MTSIVDKLQTLGDERASRVLCRLHRESSRQNAKLGWRMTPYLHRWLLRRPLPWAKLEKRFSDLYIALDPDNGILCYLLVRALRARTIVEFGTSFGVSTIYLALAVRDNGGGIVVGTELVPEKAAKARENIREAGLEEYVDIRVGDAMETLDRLPGPVDFLLNDGFPRFVLPVLQGLAPRMRAGAITLCGNAALFPADHVDYLRWVRDPANGFCSSPLQMTLAGEFSVKVSEDTASRDAQFQGGTE